jgi:hypothetical protein
MPGGNTPTGSVSGNSVTLTWTASSFAEEAAVPSYVIRRYDGITSTEATVAGGCAGTVTATSCTENGVPIGSWRYTVTPGAGAWRDAESLPERAPTRDDLGRTRPAENPSKALTNR